MDVSLNASEVRVLGCLMEKEMATPDYYPLSLNALINACNQKSNRDPVVAYAEETVVAALDGLRQQRLVSHSDVGRVTKYEQVFSAALKLVASEQAVVCTLLLRGPQTVGEIRARTERLHPFGDLAEVQDAITSLENLALVAKLPRQPGRKESRYAHLLSGDTLPAIEALAAEATVAEKASRQGDRLDDLQAQIDDLRDDLRALKRAFEAFASQFE